MRFLSCLLELGGDEKGWDGDELDRRRFRERVLGVGVSIWLVEVCGAECEAVVAACAGGSCVGRVSIFVECANGPAMLTGEEGSEVDC